MLEKQSLDYLDRERKRSGEMEGVVPRNITRNFTGSNGKVF